MEDIHDKMLEWGPECMINPFKEVYDVSIPNVTLGPEIWKSNSTSDRISANYSHEHL